MVVNGLNIFIIEVYYRCCMVLMGYMKVSGFRYWIFLNGLKKRKNRCFVVSFVNVREVYVFLVVLFFRKY